MKTLSVLAVTFLIATTGVGQTLSGFKICLDPGHGGHNPANDRLVVPDPGVEFWESESNFQKSLLLKSLLEAKGAAVYLTRTTNDYPDDALEPSLTARWQFANSVGVDWFHSIHSNAFNASTNYTLLLVRESTTSAGQPQSPQAYAMSQIISPKIQAHLRTTANYTRLDYSFLGYRLGVLSGLAMPGQLSEGSFHDVLPETRRLMNQSYRKMEAYAILKSVMQYLNVPSDTPGIIAGIQTEAESGKPINSSVVKLQPENITFSGDLYNNGFFMFDNVPPGTHTLQFETPGYSTTSMDVIVVSGGVHFADKVLSSSLPPQLLSSSPANNEIGVSRKPTIVLTFSRTMDRNSVQQNLYLLDAASNRVSTAMTWSNSDRTVSLIPADTLLPDTTYTVVVSGLVKDTSNRFFDGNKDGTGGDSLAIVFRTQPFDVTPPYILTSSPASQSAFVSTTPIINITFNERLSPSTITLTNFELKEVGGSAISRQLQQWNTANKTGVNILPDVPLQAGKTYRITVANVADLWGNQISTPIISDFSVPSAAFQAQKIAGFDVNESLWKQPALDTFTVGFIYDSTNILRSFSQLIPSLSENSSSFRLRYGWNLSNPPWLISSTASDQAKGTEWLPLSTKLQLYMFGDGSGNSFRFVIEDSVDGFPGGTIDHREVSRWIPIDWVGWRIVEWDFDRDSVGVWLGNGTIEGKVRIGAFQIQYSPGGAQFGAVYFDHLQLLKPVSTFADEANQVAPSDFRLHQNYPNPFNPETVIEYDVARATMVRLDILDVLGRGVATLVNSYHFPGRYRVGWNTIGLNHGAVASGIYFYRLRAGDRVETRKMLLLR